MARRTSPQPSEGKLNLLGPKLRLLRESKGWRQIDLVFHLQKAGWDIDPVTANKIENGLRTLTDIELLFILKVLKRRLSDWQK